MLMLWGKKKKRGRMLSIRKNCEVEVSSEEEKFKGSWNRAILEENPTKLGQKKLRVRYTALFEDDGSTPFTETLDRSSIRPVPPENLYDGVVLEEGSIVDAYLRSGWWIGSVVKKMEKDKFLVYFDLKPDIIEFERMELRAHFDWTGSKWIRPENKQLVSSVFSSGTTVELRHDFAWAPVMIIKEVENEKKFLVEFYKKFFNCHKKSRIIVDLQRVRPKQPPFSVGKYELLDHVEVFSGCVWRQGVVRGVLYEGRQYMVSFGATKEASQFNHSDLRPLMEWEDGVWHKTPKPKLEEGLGNEKMLEEHNNKYDTRKRNRGELDHNSDFNEKVLSSDQTSNMVKNSIINVEETQAKYTMLVLPFSKKSPFWKTYETMEVFKRVPQNPHFSPLLETKEDFREGFALGMMMTFSGLLEKVKVLEDDVPVSELDSLKDSFVELEKHGFDVTIPLSRIDKFLALRDSKLNVMEQLKGFDKEMADESSKKCEVEEEFSNIEHKILEVKHKILELQWEEVVLKEHKKAVKEQKDVAYKKIHEIESCVRNLGLKLEDIEFEFKTTLSAPW